MTLDTLQAKFQEGWALHQKGQLAQAREIYGQVLKDQPLHFDALNLSGIIAAQGGQFAAAADLIGRAVAVNPNNAGAQYNLGLALGHLARHQEALASYERAIALKPDYAAAHLSRGNVLCVLKQVETAVASYDAAIQLSPNLAEAHNNRGNALLDLKKYDAALISFDRAVALNPGIAEAHYNRGNALRALKRDQDAIASYGKAVALSPGHAKAHYDRAILLKDSGRFQESLEAFDKTIAAKPDFVDAYNERGIVLSAMGQPEAALASYDKAIQLRPSFVEAYANRGVCLRQMRRYQDAIGSFDNALAVNPGHAGTLNSRGTVLMDLNLPEAALVDYDKAVALAPTYAEAFNNRGAALMALGRKDDALQSYERAAQLKPALTDAHYNLANTLVELKQHAAAIERFDRALALDPQFPYLYGARLHARMQICDWKGMDADLAVLVQKLERGERCTSPFPVLALCDAPALQAMAAEIWAQDKNPPNPALGLIAKRPKRGKIRIGYFSMDFRDHPVALLVAKLIEIHDREKFEIYGFSFGSDTGDATRQRLVNAFDKFFDLRANSDYEIAALARQEDIDIAVDLGGYTHGARTGIFALRAAPIQVNYLGYPGTLGVDFMDYILADATVIPGTHRHHYSEKIATLPYFQANDDTRNVAAATPSRADLGLPPGSFVFCCFNNSYKICPQTFDGWMRILKKAEGSVLFLYADNDSAEKNLRKEAAARGVNPTRLVFGKRLPVPEYLARYRAADLFLDTLPYNAGTTASDALWVGLPVLTCIGESFASRMAASLLRAVGLPELIATTQVEYEALAIDLAADRARMTALKDKLAGNRATAPLFDAPRFAGHIQRAYTAMAERHWAGLPPDHIGVL